MSIKQRCSYEYTVECTPSFSHLKQLMSSVPVIAYPQFSHGYQFLIETDANKLGSSVNSNIPEE